MWWIALISGLIFGLSICITSFHTGLKESSYYYLWVLIAGNLSTLVWSSIARSSNDLSAVYSWGSAYDGAIVVSWYILSILIFKIPITTTGIIGLLMIVIGIFVLKI